MAGGSLLNSQERSARWKAIIPVLAVAALVVVADQLVKLWIVATIGRGQPTHQIVLLPDWLVLQYTENAGTAFGLVRVPVLPAALAIATIAVILVIVLRLGRASQAGEDLPNWRVLLSLGLVLGGGIGNVIDRFTRGYVVDFILVPAARVTLNGKVYQWPNFNVADSAITIGIILLLITMLLSRERKTPEP